MKFISLGSVYGTVSSKMKQFLTTPGLARRPHWGNPLIKEDDFERSVETNAEEFLVQPLGCDVAE